MLYRLPEVIAAVQAGEPVFIVEGEKDVNRLVALGFCATTNPMGAGKWGKVDSSPLGGAQVVILPDNDAPGRDHAAEVKAGLEAHGCEVTVVELPGIPEKGDITDWLDAGHAADDLRRMVDETHPSAHQGPWDTQSLIDAMSGNYEPPQRGILYREDGEGLLYPGQIIALVAEPEAGKTTVAYVALQAASLDMPVVLIDFEMGPAQAAERLRLLGVNQIGADWAYAWNRPIADVVASVPEGAFVVIDATDGGFAHLDLDPDRTKDANTFKARVIDALKVKRCTVLLLDHASTSRQERKRGAMGSTKKLGNVDVSLYLKVEAPGSPGHIGKYQVYVDKDRSAQLRGISDRKGEADHLTTMLTEAVDGVFLVEFLNPQPFRPTYLMERISQWLEEQDKPKSKTAVENGVTGKADAIRMALDLLVNEGYVERTHKGQAQLHFTLRPYREGSDRRDRRPVPVHGDADGVPSFERTTEPVQTPSPVEGGDGVQDDASQPRRDGAGRGETGYEGAGLLSHIIDVFDAVEVADTRQGVERE